MNYYGAASNHAIGKEQLFRRCHFSTLPKLQNVTGRRRRCDRIPPTRRHPAVPNRSEKCHPRIADSESKDNRNVRHAEAHGVVRFIAFRVFRGLQSREQEDRRFSPACCTIFQKQADSTARGQIAGHVLWSNGDSRPLSAGARSARGCPSPALPPELSTTFTTNDR
jgi:hypothetical protein